MKKKIAQFGKILLLIIFIFLLFLAAFVKFTGFAVKEPENKIKFYFYDEEKNCSLNGYVFIGDKAIGKTENGNFNLSYGNYLKNFQDPGDKISIFGKLDRCFNKNLYFDKYFIVPKINKYNFLGETLFEFKTKINPNNPLNREFEGFIQPGDKELTAELNNLNLDKKNTLEDLTKINQYLNYRVNYSKDWDFNREDNYWQTPPETLKTGQGDCEDFSVALLSLFITYSPYLNCYNVIFSTHVTTFCHIGNYYAYYDQQEKEIKKEIDSSLNTIEFKSQIKELNKEYFEYYGINSSETQPHYAYNDNDFTEFKNENEFIDWQYNIRNKKNNYDLFSEIEKQITENTKNLPESDLGEGELRTQTISFPNLKAISILYPIIPVFIIFIILVIWFIKNRR